VLFPGRVEVQRLPVYVYFSHATWNTPKRF
jgi:hypothetical protein